MRLIMMEYIETHPQRGRFSERSHNRVFTLVTFCSKVAAHISEAMELFIQWKIKENWLWWRESAAARYSANNRQYTVLCRLCARRADDPAAAQLDDGSDRVAGHASAGAEMDDYETTLLIKQQIERDRLQIAVVAIGREIDR